MVEPLGEVAPEQVGGVVDGVELGVTGRRVARPPRLARLGVPDPAFRRVEELVDGLSPIADPAARFLPQLGEASPGAVPPVAGPVAVVAEPLGDPARPVLPQLRETVADRSPTDPCMLEVAFRLRRVRGSGHALFRLESILNTPLFVGFPGFVSKLWVAHDRHGIYRGLYEWDGPDRAEHYARSLWRVLELVCEKGSIAYRVAPRLRRDDVLAAPHVLDPFAPEEERAWWRVVPAA
jgi:hypothetical protein